MKFSVLKELSDPLPVRVKMLKNLPYQPEYTEWHTFEPVSVDGSCFPKESISRSFNPIF